MGRESETAIILAAQGGSEPAWRALFDLHFDPVYRFCLALASGRRELAEETTQQTFITAARSIGGFRPEQGTFRAWLLGIARNRYRTFRAQERRRRRHESLPGREERAPSGSREPDLGVHETLARLPVEYRRALEDKYLKRLTMNEMARAEGMTVEAIESLLRRARDRFASVYEQIRDRE